jgi:predicted nucleotidyltransferase
MGINIEYLERRCSQRKIARLSAVDSCKNAVIAALRPFSPSHIYIFGSLMKATWDPEISDIDIAVKGVASDKTAQMDKALKDAFGHDNFDIVLMEYAEKSLLESILHEGELVYEK